MSEQDKRAERWMFLGDRIERRTKGPWDEPTDYVRADDHAAALAQARRKGFIVAAKYYDDRGVTDEEINLDADELLAKEEGRE